MSMERKNFFTVGNSEICVDYSGYSDASKEYKKLEKKAAKKRFRYSSDQRN